MGRSGRQIEQIWSGPAWQGPEVLGWAHSQDWGLGLDSVLAGFLRHAVPRCPEGQAGLVRTAVEGPPAAGQGKAGRPGGVSASLLEMKRMLGPSRTRKSEAGPDLTSEIWVLCRWKCRWFHPLPSHRLLKVIR